MARRFAKVSEEEIKTAFFYPSDLVNTKTTIPLKVGEERWIYTSTLRVSVYIYHYSPPLREIYIYIFIIHQIFSLAIGLNASHGRISEDIPQFLKPMDNKHNSLNLAPKICSNICPWTLSVPRSSQFSSSFALGKLFASWNR